MLLLKEKNEQIVLQTDGKVDVYAAWIDTPAEGGAGGPGSMLDVLGGASEIPMITFPSEGVLRRNIAAINISARDQKQVVVRVYITNGTAQVLLFTAHLDPDQSVRFSPAGGFVPGAKPPAAGSTE